MKWYSVTFGASRFSLRKGRNQEHVFKKEREIIVYHCLLNGLKTKMDWAICFKTKQRAKAFRLPLVTLFEVKTYLKQNAAYENENRGGCKIINWPANVFRWFYIIQADREFYELKIKHVFPANPLSLRRNNR